MIILRIFTTILWSVALALQIVIYQKVGFEWTNSFLIVMCSLFLMGSVRSLSRMLKERKKK